jgi:hypothetical protein
MQRAGPTALRRAGRGRPTGETIAAVRVHLLRAAMIAVLRARRSIARAAAAAVVERARRSIARAAAVGVLRRAARMERLRFAAMIAAPRDHRCVAVASAEASVASA